MGIEIERKFLIISDDWRRGAGAGQRFCQGYIARSDGNSVRVRRAGDRGYVTIKGPRIGIARREYEYDVPVEEAEEMLAMLCVRPLIEKIRYRVEYRGATWDVDVFSGIVQGLIMAEIELVDQAQAFDRPPWIGAEVTDDPRYRNSALARRNDGQSDRMA